MKLLRDTMLVFERQLILLRREPLWLVLGTVQPGLYLLLFGPVLKQSTGAQSYGAAYQGFVPGLLVMLTIFGTLFVGFTLVGELRAGVVERNRMTPMNRVALLLGRCLADIVTLLAQSTIVIVFALPFGISTRVLNIAVVYLIMGFIALLMSSVSYGAALRLRSEGALSPVLNAFTQPLLLLSGILLPITAATAPRWLLEISRLNPFSWAVGAVRSAFAGDLGNTTVWRTLLVFMALATVSVAWAARSFARDAN